jgi:DDB1- and CUL4-associated factor 1
VFKAILDLFDARDGLQNLFYILNGYVSGSGDNSGGLGSSNVNQGNDHLLKFGLHQKSRLHTI